MKSAEHTGGAVPRNVVVCCDGTANQFAKDNTNVVKLYSMLVHDQAVQLTYYHPGVGTMEPPGALTPLRRRFTRLLGLAVGAYLEHDIRDAYAFLMNNCQPGDRVFFFGFSRGAYTARAVASLLRMYGLLRPGQEPLIPYAIRMMTAIMTARDRGAQDRGAQDAHKETIDAYFDLAAEFKATMSRECPTKFIGVWDTVSAVGWIENPLRLPYTADNSAIDIGRHAIAIDERRAFFRTNLWRHDSDDGRNHGPRDSLQVWFPGVHCDVGGGYPERESGLSKLALEWMADEAEAHGLLVDAAKKQEVLGLVPTARTAMTHARPDPNGVMHESLEGAWRAAEFVPKRHYNWTTRKIERRMNRGRRRTIPSGSWIHWSAYERTEHYADRLPIDVQRLPKRDSQ
ncbi:MAG: DUF2235 domain-containing protein [Acidobacteriota bacterium]